MAKSGNIQMKWTVGVVTAPRENACYLHQTLNSLRRTGFSDPVVFAEPGCAIDQNVQVVHRRKKYGDWTNWATAFYELLLSEPDTDYFLMAEDDVILCQDAKQYLEYAIPQLGQFASISLYTPSIRRRKNFNGFHNELRGHQTWSTVTVVMSRPRAISFFSDSDVQRHRFENIFNVSDQFWCCPKTDPKNSIKDAVLGKWAEKINLPVLFHTPSLAEHIGDFSTLTDQPSSVENGRRSFDFVGEEFSLQEWMQKPVELRSSSVIKL